nr:hypothetical protein [Tanacetum cinerariifolium]
MGDEHFDTIPETESNKFIKSSVENIVPNPSESEDLSDSECDVLACDDFTTYSNLLFDVDDNFSSSDNESFFDEDIFKEIYSNPLFNEEIISMKIDPHHFNVESDLIESLLNHDSSIISSSSNINSLLDEFAGELTLLKSIPSRIDETNCDLEEEICLIEKLLYDNSSPRPPEEFISKNSDAGIESFSPSPIPVEDSDSFIEEIDLSFTLDDSMPSGIEEDDYDSERDMLIFEEWLSNDSLSLPENESFHFDIPSFPRPPAIQLNDDSGILTVKMVGDISELAGNAFTYDPIPKSFNEVQSISNPPPQSHYNIYLCQICESNSHYGYECVTPLIDHHCCYKCVDSLNDFFCHQCSCEFYGNGAHDGYNCPSHVPFIQTLPSFPQQYPCCEDCGGPRETFQCQPMNYFESNTCYDSNYSCFDQIEPPQYSVNPSLNIQSELSHHELFINDLIQQKLQNEYAQSFSPIAITFDLPTMETEDSVRIRDEHFDTIPKTELEKFIKSSVENLVPNPSESEDLSDSECISKEIYLNPLFDEEIISMKIDPHHFNAEIDETNCDPEEEIHLIEKLLYDNSSPRLPEEFISENSDAAIKSFSPSPILVEDSDSFMDEIDLSFTSDDSMPLGIEEDDYESERDMLIFEELLSNYSFSLPENESFHFDIPSFPRPPVKPPNDDSGTLTVKIVGDISELYVPIPKLLPTQPTLVSNKKKSPHLLSYRGFKASHLHSE